MPIYYEFIRTYLNYVFGTKTRITDPIFIFFSRFQSSTTQHFVGSIGPRIRLASNWQLINGLRSTKLMETA